MRLGWWQVRAVAEDGVIEYISLIPEDLVKSIMLDSILGLVEVLGCSWGTWLDLIASPARVGRRSNHGNEAARGYARLAVLCEASNSN